LEGFEKPCEEPVCEDLEPFNEVLEPVCEVLEPFNEVLEPVCEVLEPV